MRRFSLFALVSGALVPMLLASAPSAAAQDRAVTLADAIRLSEKVQPGMVQARADITHGRGTQTERVGLLSPDPQRQLLRERVLLGRHRPGGSGHGTDPDRQYHQP